MNTSATTVVIAFAFTAAIGCEPPPPIQPKPPEPFEHIARVLAHPRCVNCHPGGDSPLIGEDSRPHGMQVRRGADGKGITTTVCTNCHQQENLVGEHMPPGVPSWRMPPQQSPMVFKGKSARQLCLSITDPVLNGGRSLPELLTHLTDDPFVRWGWSPGDGRVPVPGTHAEFAASARAWIGGGARCP